MPVFRVQVKYSKNGSNKWSNVWHVSSTTLALAASKFQDFGVPDLLPLLNNACIMDGFLVSDLDGAEFVTVPINENGTSGASGDLLPLFNSVKVLFEDGSLGRPDYKYLKGLLTEGGQIDSVIDATTIGVIDGLIEALIVDLDGEGCPLVSADNDQYTAASVQPLVQMRQMHRRRRRTPAP